ncbi:MAG: DHHA1 domain-containing protein, partial [Microcystaceae cyanobacterium]
VPVFIGTNEDGGMIRGSARSIDEFNVFEALVYCQDLLGKFGGHRAAGGFNLAVDNLISFQQKLSEFAQACLLPEYLKPLIKIDGIALFKQLNFDLCHQIEQLQPWGIGNEFPIFWTPQVRILQQKIVGQNHLRLELQDDSTNASFSAVAWRWGEYFPLPSPIDIAYKLEENNFNGNTSLQLQLVGVRLSEIQNTIPSQTFNSGGVKKTAIFNYQNRVYRCSYGQQSQELRIKNDQGKVLAWKRGESFALLGESREKSQKVDIDKMPYSALIQVAITTLALEN